MGRKGGSKNERKINQDRHAEARQREQQARTELRELLSLPVNRRTPAYAELVRRQAGILKEAIDSGKKSETHSRKGKGGKA